MRLNILAGFLFFSFILPVTAQTQADVNNSHKAEQEVIKWLKNNAIPIKSASPEKYLEEMSFLPKIVGDKKIVLLGEGTHGTREFFLMKDKIVRYLIEKQNFKNLGMEYDMINALPMQEYIQTGRGDSENALNQQRGWVWNTEEVLSTAEWLKTYNEKNNEKANYVGIDIFAVVPTLIYSLGFFEISANY